MNTLTELKTKIEFRKTCILNAYGECLVCLEVELTEILHRKDLNHENRIYIEKNLLKTRERLEETHTEVSSLLKVVERAVTKRGMSVV